MLFNYGNSTPIPHTAVVENVSASMADPAAVIPPTQAQVPLLSSVIAPAELVVEITLTLSQVPLPQILGGSDGSATARGGSYGHSACASLRQRARNDPTPLFLIVSFTARPLLVEAVVADYTTISRFCVSTHANLEALLLRDGNTPTLDDVDDLRSISSYANLYIRAWGNSVSKTMCQ